MAKPVKNKKVKPYLPLRKFRPPKKPLCDLDRVCYESFAERQLRRKKRLDRDKVIEFEGTIKFRLMRPPVTETAYGRNCIAGLYVLSYIIMGMVVMSLYYFSIRFYLHYSVNLHVVMCGGGFYFLLPAAYMMKQKPNLPGHFLSDYGRKSQGVLLRYLALIVIGIGYFIFLDWSFRMDRDFNIRHSVTGFLVFVCASTEAILFATSLICIGKLGSFVSFIMSLLRIVVMVSAAWCYYEVSKFDQFRYWWTRPEIADTLRDFVFYITFVAILVDLVKGIHQLIICKRRIQCVIHNITKPKCKDTCFKTKKEAAEYYDSLLRSDLGI